MSDYKSKCVKKYIDGNSLTEILDYLKTQGLSPLESELLVIETHQILFNKRKNRALRDLFIALISIGYAIYWFYKMLIEGNMIANPLFIISLFLWIPFLKSAIKVLKNLSAFNNLTS